MSTNLIRWTTRRLENLLISVDDLALTVTPEMEARGWHFDVEADIPNRTIKITYDSFTLIGTIIGDKIDVQEIELTGEGSMHIWFEILKPVLEKSTGLLEVRQVWEDGDVLNVTVKDGVITREEL